MTLSHSSVFTESRSRSTASISLQSSPNHSLTKSTALAQSLRPHTLSLSLISISYLSLLVSDTNSSLKRSLYLSLSISISNPQIKSLKSLHQILKSHTNALFSHSLIFAVPSPISYEISNLHHFNFHQSSIFTL